MTFFNIKPKLKSEFAKNSATLFSGTALAQIVPLIVTPILTRLYTPSDYGVLAVFAATTAIVASISTLRYDIAILLPNEDENAMTISLLAMLCTLGTALITLAILCIAHNEIVSLIKSPAMSSWLFAIPLSIFFFGWNNSLNYWLNRHKQFRKLAINRVTVAIVASAATITFGFLGFGYSGLIIGSLIGQFATMTMLIIWTWRDFFAGLRDFNWFSIKQQAKEYKKFPLFSLPADWVNSFSQQLPALALSRFFGQSVVGHFSFSQKILGLPLGLLSQSVLDVFKQRASSDYSKYGNCKDIFDKTTNVLTALSIVPSIIIFFFAPLIFKVGFGNEWTQSGHYARYLAPLYFFRFIVSPLSYVFYVANRQDADLIGQISLLMVSIGSMLLGAWLNNPDIAIISFSVGYIMVYVFYFWGARKLARGASLMP
jgi:O-antigen/teichoic acid export membrane protein